MITNLNLLDFSRLDIAALGNFEAKRQPVNKDGAYPTLVTFRDSSTRDHVLSKSNRLQGKTGKIEIFYPGFLATRLRLLNRKAFELRRDTKCRTSIRLEDSTKSLSLYIKERGQTTWVHHDIADNNSIP